MTSYTYDQARADFEFLESLQELDDQVELDAEREALMRQPTKRKAAEMYASAIRLWFGERRRQGTNVGGLEEIEDRYCLADRAALNHAKEGE